MAKGYDGIDDARARWIGEQPMSSWPPRRSGPTATSTSVAGRDLLARGAQRRGPEGLAAYRAEKNALSIDRLPGLRP